MQANEVFTAANPEVRQSAPQIASWRHLVGFLLIGAGMVALGFLAQHVPAGGGAGDSSGHLGRHSQAIHIDLTIILMDWALLYYCWCASPWRQSKNAFGRALDLVEKSRD